MGLAVGLRLSKEKSRKSGFLRKQWVLQTLLRSLVWVEKNKGTSAIRLKKKLVKKFQSVDRSG